MNYELGIESVDGRAITDRPYRCGEKFGDETSSATLSVSASADSSPRGRAKIFPPRRGASVMRRDPSKGKTPPRHPKKGVQRVE